MTSYNVTVLTLTGSLTQLGPYLLGLEDEGNLQVLQGLRVDLVVRLGLHHGLSLAGHIAGPVAGLEVVTVDQTTWISRSLHSTPC